MGLAVCDQKVSIFEGTAAAGRWETGRVEWRALRSMAAEDFDWGPLLERARREESEAQRELVSVLWPRIAPRLARLCPRRDDVEELAQLVYLKVFDKLWQFRGGSFEAWVDRIARRVCYDALRKQSVRPEWRFSDLENFDVEMARDRSEQVSTVDASEILAQLFKRLPPEQAWLLNEVEIQERSIGEVSQELGWTAVAGRLRLMRARKKLKTLYEAWDSVGGDFE